MQLAHDVYHDLKGCIRKYLPKELKEPQQAYGDRLKRTRFDNRFKPAIGGLAGLLGEFTLNEDVAPSILDAKNNVDGQGNSLHAFFSEADTLALRDGWCGIYVEYPPASNEIESQADFIASGRRPYFVLIDRRDILNWRFIWQGDIQYLTQVTIRERRIVPDGAFGEAEKIYYRVLTPGQYQVFEIIENKQDFQLLLIEEGATSLDFVPLVYYSVNKSALFSAEAPLLNLAELNIEHFQKRSELNEVMRKCNLPVPVRQGLIRNAEDIKKAPPIIIGPNSGLDIPADGKFYFAEPSGAAIASTEQRIDKLEAAMDRLSLAFLTGGENNRTATEVMLDSAQTTASLKQLAERKESNVQQCFQFWAAYTGEVEGGTISQDKNLLQMPLAPEATQRLIDLAQTGFISHEALLLLLRLGKILPREFDIQRELQLVGNTRGDQFNEDQATN
ncbi:MAG: DUF4055 domain-containing protein [Calothrix sp. FI2-JRJ7]|nr:DUF4055 domain-containing protein [Calothrix sp. FI2-JRJ7]